MSEELITLKEFEFVINESNMKKVKKDSKKYYPLSKEDFQELNEFVRKQNDNDEESDEESDASKFFKSYYKQGIGDVIQAKNYVGLIQLESGVQVQVLPKIDTVNERDEEHSTSYVFIDMLRSMEVFKGKIFSSANLRSESMNLYEIFINMYVHQVSKLTRRGLKSSYLRTEDNLYVFKGKLIVSEHIKKNIAHDERFYVAFDEYSQNRPENRIIKATLLKLQKISTDSNNIKAIRQQLTFFEMIEPSVNYSKDFSKIVIDRNTKDYEEVISWSKVFLMNKSVFPFVGDNKVRALLFPMEKLYEAYVGQNIKYIFGEKGFKVSLQDKREPLFTKDGEPVFRLMPDIVVSDEYENKVIMDTKWKRLNSQKTNYDISQSDMYQMFAYSKKYKAKDIWLLYPMVDSVKVHKPIIYKDGEETTVSVFFVDVANVEESLNELLRQVKEQFTGGKNKEERANAE